MNNNPTPLQQITTQIYCARIIAYAQLERVPNLALLLNSCMEEAIDILKETTPAAPEVKPLDWMIDKNKDLLSTNGEFHIVTKNRETGHENVCLYSDTGFVITLIASNFRSENDAMRYANFIRTK